MKLNAIHVILGLFVVIMLGLTGCGGGSTQNTTQTPATISSLQYTPTTLAVNTPTTINWQFNFSDPGGDISTGTYTVFNPNGVQVYSQTINLAIPAGKNTGTEFGTTSNITFVTVGTYTVNMFVTDSAGASSNTLSATFTTVP